MFGTGLDIVVDIATEAERIERAKNGLALTEDEARTVKAAAFLRQIAPYLFETPQAAAAVDPHDGTSNG